MLTVTLTTTIVIATTTARWPIGITLSTTRTTTVITIASNGTTRSIAGTATPSGITDVMLVITGAITSATTRPSSNGDISAIDVINGITLSEIGITIDPSSANGAMRAELGINSGVSAQTAARYRGSNVK